MTLIQLIRRNIIMSMLIILLIGTASHFFIFRFFMHYSTNEILYEYKDHIVNYIHVNDTLPLAGELVLQPARIEARQISETENLPSTMFKDTLLYSEMTGSFNPYRQLYFPVKYKNRSYYVNINQPTMEPDDLLYAVITSLLVLFALFMVFTYAISHSLKKNISAPLNRNLEKLKAYDLKANSELNLEDHSIQEFDELNSVIMKMVQKINMDYENSRIFSEDASHEMQTPLSIIKSKIDLLLQDNVTDNEKIDNLTAMSRAVSRLSRLNKSLLLLTKINNDQFYEKEDTDIGLLIKNYLFDLEELIEAKKINMEYNLQPYICNVNPILAEILVSNLLSNSIKHNIGNGWIRISLVKGILKIENTCEKHIIKENLFQRLIHRKKADNSTGLGLNIVKSVCDKSGFEVRYSIGKNTFCIEVDFNEE